MTPSPVFDPWSLTRIHNLNNLFGWTALALLSSLVLVVCGRRRKGATKVSNHTLFSQNTMLEETLPVKTAPPPGHVVVSKILIHPIKSCRGISVQSANYTPEGLENDRIWCIIDAVKLRVLTAREVPKMVLITSFIESNGTLRVTFPEGSGCKDFAVPLKPEEENLKEWTILPQITLWPTHPPVDGYICESTVGTKDGPSQSLSQFMERPVHLVYKGPQPRAIDATTSFPDLDATAKYQDMYPLLVLSAESTAAVDETLRGYVGTQGIDARWREDNVVIERHVQKSFRPNIVFSGGGPFAEDDWEEISLGSADAPTITLVSKCTRCLLPNVNPDTGERDKAVPYKVIMKFRTGLDPKEKMKPCVGCNGVPSGNGTVNVGDWVYVKKMI